MDFFALGIGGAAYLVIRSIVNKATMEVPVVFAGTPMGGYANSRVIPIPKNRPIYREGEQEIDVSSLKQFVLLKYSISSSLILNFLIYSIILSNPPLIAYPPLNGLVR